MDAPTEWQCSCGAWVPVGYARHPHVQQTRPRSAAELIEQRRRMEMGQQGDIALDDTIVTHEWRTKDHPTR